MSRLIDRISKQRQPEAQPMGFLANRAQNDKVKMLLMVETTVEFWEKEAAVLKAADAVIVDVNKADDLSVLEKSCQEKAIMPVGGWLNTTSAGALKKAAATECDFIVFTTAAPAALTRKEKLGRLMEIDINLTDGLLRAAAELPVDALIAGGKNNETGVTLNRLLYLQRLISLSGKPVLAAMPENSGSPELQCLWDMGVAGVWVEVNDAKSAESLSGWRELIDKLEAPAFRKKGKTLALLPKATASPAHHHEEEEEEEEE